MQDHLCQKKTNNRVVPQLLKNQQKHHPGSLLPAYLAIPPGHDLVEAAAAEVDPERAGEGAGRGAALLGQLARPAVLEQLADHVPGDGRLVLLLDLLRLWTGRRPRVSTENGGQVRRVEPALLGL